MSAAPRNLVDAALDVAKCSPVFPCRPDKRPATKHGFKDATSDPATVRQQFARGDAALIGVPTGPDSGLLVLDLDGDTGMAWLREHGGKLPTTREHDTPRGRHLLFCYPRDETIGSSAGKISLGVDIRGLGGYIVWHPANGHVVRNDETIVPAPEWLLALVRKPTGKSSPDAVSAGKIAEGARNASLASLAGKLRRIGATPDEIDDVLATLNSTRCDPPLEPDEVRAIAASIARYEPSEALALAFPVLTADEYLARPRPKWRVKGVLPEGGLALIYGQSGSGKSFLVLDLAAAIVAGDPWRSRAVRRGRVAYIVAEGVGGFRNRIEALKISGRDLSGLMLIPASPDLRRETDVAALIESVIAHGGASVVIVDTLAQTTPGANENAGEDMSVALKAAQRIAETLGALVVLIHHSGKDQSRGARGWSGIKGALDAEVEVLREGVSRVATISKQKDGEEGQRFAFDLRPVMLGQDEDGEPVSSCIVVHLDDSASVAPIMPKLRLGKHESLVLRIVEDLVGLGTSTTAETVMQSAVAQMTSRGDGKPDRRRDRVREAIDALVGRSLICQSDGRITLPGEA